MKTLSHLRISDLGILFKQQAKQNKMTLQGQHNSCEEQKLSSTDTNRQLLKKKGGMSNGASPSLDA